MDTFDVYFLLASSGDGLKGIIMRNRDVGPKRVIAPIKPHPPEKCGTWWNELKPGAWDGFIRSELKNQKVQKTCLWCYAIVLFCLLYPFLLPFGQVHQFGPRFAKQMHPQEHSKLQYKPRKMSDLPRGPTQPVPRLCYAAVRLCLARLPELGTVRVWFVTKTPRHSQATSHQKPKVASPSDQTPGRDANEVIELNTPLHWNK